LPSAASPLAPQGTTKSNAACAVANQQGPTTNKTTASLAATLASVQSQSCTVSSDARCTTAALTAVFGHYPGVLAAYCNANFLVLHCACFRYGYRSIAFAR
jgi:hypothetical protein